MSATNQAGALDADGVNTGSGAAGGTVNIPELEKLDLPDMSPISMFKHFGPGLMLAMTGIGTSHLVSAPVAGGQYSFALLWSVLAAYVMKYYGFQMSFRFTNATGKSIMDAMCTTPGKWAIWYVFGLTVLQCALGQAGRVVACAAVLFFFGTDYLGLPLELWHWAVLITIACLALVLSGQYKRLELVTKVFVIMLALTSFIVFFWNPPPFDAYTYFVRPHPDFGYVPPGSILILAAFLGLLPTGIDVALQSSEWGKAKKSGLPMLRQTLEDHGVAGKFDSFNPRREDLTVNLRRLSPHVQEYCHRWFRIGNADFAFGHIMSFFVACVFLMLAAIYLYPSDVSGRAVMGELARMFTESVGPGMMFVFILGALAATFSTALNYFDGWPRVVAACARNMFRRTAELDDVENPSPEAKSTWYSEHNVWRITMIYSAIASNLIIYGIERPVFLVLIASAMTLLFSPVIFYFMFKFCLDVIPKDDPVYYPNAAVRNFTWLCLFIFTAATLWVFYLRIIA